MLFLLRLWDTRLMIMLAMGLQRPKTDHIVSEHVVMKKEKLGNRKYYLTHFIEQDVNNTEKTGKVL